jgi:hypothetical protein
MTALCQRDGSATRLRCAQCDVGICPACLVRTPIGYKCQRCVGRAGATPRGRPARRRIIIAATLVAPLAFVGRVMFSDDTAPPVAVPAPSAEAEPTRQAMIGEEARDGQLVFVVDRFACDTDQAASGAQTTGKLCTLGFSVRNVSTSPARLLGRFQYLVDAQSRTYGMNEALTRAASEIGGPSLSELNINPDVAVALHFVFHVPHAVEPTQAQVRGTGVSRIGVNVRLDRRA